MAYRVAVVGAAEMAGREALRALAESRLPVGEVVALGSGRTGTEISYGEEAVLRLRSVTGFDFAGTALALFAGSEAEAEHIPRALAAGAAVLDASPRHRLDPGVPLLLPGALPAEARRPRRALYSVPDPMAAQLALALAPLHAAAPLRRLTVVTGEATSALGKSAMDELFAQTRGVYVNDNVLPQEFPKPIAFNLIPQVERFLDSGADSGEERLAGELRKLIAADIAVSVTRVRAPIFVGHAAAVHAGFAEAIPLRAARDALRDAPGLVLYDRREDGGYDTPVEVAGEDGVHISRLRADPGQENGLAFWCVADNLRGIGNRLVAAAEWLHEAGRLPAGRLTDT